MCVKWGLDRVPADFHSIHFFVSFSLKPKSKEIEHIIKLWTFHILITIRKITIIKPLIVSKLNHLFFSLIQSEYGIDQRI